jgi:RNA polymerase sigma-70 factor (ECF subfamily)
MAITAALSRTTAAAASTPTASVRGGSARRLRTPALEPEAMPIRAEPPLHPLRKTTTDSKRIAACSDLELLERFQAGEEQAFAELYGRHKQQVYTYCARMLGGDQDMASDAFQDVFIKVYEKASQFREGTNVTGWLFMIARNTCLNVFRSRKPNECIDDHAELESADRSLAPEFAEEQHFLRAKLEQAIAQLPEEYREPLVLREFDGLGYAAIAKIMGTTLPVVKVRIYRAKQKLRDILRPYVSE